MIPALITLAAALLAGIWWLAVSVKQIHARRLSMLASLPCPKCGQIFGPAVAAAAHEAHRVEYNEARRLHPDCKINFARFWPVCCPACICSTEFHYEKFQLQTRDA